MEGQTHYELREMPRKNLTPDRTGTYGGRPVKRARKKETLAPLALNGVLAVRAGVPTVPERFARNQRNLPPARYLRREPAFVVGAKDAAKEIPRPRDGASGERLRLTA